METLCTLQDIADMCGVTIQAARVWKNEGKLPRPVIENKEQMLWTRPQAKTVLKWHLSKVQRRTRSTPT